MSQQNVEVVREMHAAFNRGDYEAALSALAEDLQWHAPGALTIGTEVYKGRDAVAREIGRWLGAWESYRFEIREIADCDDCVFVAGDQTARGRDSGVEVVVPTFHVYTVRHGRITSMRPFDTRAAALEAAGLSE